MRCSAPKMRASSTCTAPSASAARRFTRKRQHECRRPATKRLRGVSICTFVPVTQAKVSTEKQRLELAARCKRVNVCDALQQNREACRSKWGVRYFST